MNDRGAPPGEDSVGQVLRRASAMARHRQALRIAYAALGEGILPADAVIRVELDRGCITLNGAQDALAALYVIDPQKLRGVAVEAGGALFDLADPVRFAMGPLRDWARERLSGTFDLENWNAFVLELSDCARGEALSCFEREKCHALLRKTGGENFFCHVMGLERGARDGLLLQLGSFSGHRIHPAAKARLKLTGERATPLTCDEIRRYAPECAHDVDLPVLAVAEARLTTCIARLRAPGRFAPSNILQYFADGFPEVFAHWVWALAQVVGRDQVERYMPLPVHPLQIAEIEERFAGEITAGEIIFLSGVSVSQRPTLSTRTLMALERPSEPCIKTTINVQMTSVVRTLAPARAYNAPVYSDLLLSILGQDEKLNTHLRVVPEPAALYWGKSPDPASQDYLDGYHLGAVFKSHPASLLRDEEIAIPLNALFAVSPLSGARVIADVMRWAGVENASEAQAYFARYARMVLECDLGMLAGYGVGLESHQQNIDMVFERTGEPCAMLYRDINGGLEIYEPLLKANGIDIGSRSHPLRKGLHEDLEPVLRQTAHTTFFSHLVPMAHVIAREFGGAAEDFFALIRKAVMRALDESAERARRRLGEGPGLDLVLETSARIRRALLDEPLEMKALLTMRALQTQKMIFTPLANPLIPPANE